MINISELITDPDFCQTVTYIRTEYTVTNHRPSTVSEVKTTTGIITIANEDVSELGEYGNKNEEAINVYTLVPLLPVGYNEAQPTLADVVLFANQQYKVKTCLNDGQYGFYKSTAYKINPEVAFNG